MASINLVGQKPNYINPYAYIAPFTGDCDPLATLDTAITQTIFEPLTPGGNVNLTIDGHDVDSDGVNDLLLRAVGEVLDANAQATMGAIFEQSLIRWIPSASSPVDEAFITQAAARCKLPDPSKALYTTQSDVMPTAKYVLAGNAGTDLLLVSLGWTFHPHTVGFWFRTDTEFDSFKMWLRGELTKISSNINPADNRMFQQFDKIDLGGLTESLILRANDSQALDEYSFARILMWALSTWTHMQQANQPGAPETCGILPFSIAELALPRTLVLVNVEAHARASMRKINAEWDIIMKSLHNPIKLVTPGQLSKLTALARAQQKASAQAANSLTNAQHQTGRSGRIVFHKRPTRPVDIYRSVMRVLMRMSKVNQSLNAIRNVGTSFVRANRRQPNDPNKPGKVVSRKYMPDIHIYLDTSGSISEENYEDTIKMLIAFAQKMGVDLYFTSFSHVMATPVRLRIKNRSLIQVWKQFAAVPKVSGGTDYEQIYKFVNENPPLKRRLNLVITDFEWWPGSYHIDVPENLYYVPISVPDNWYEALRQSAMSFTRSMKTIDPTTGSRILGMTK
jgi:hypothetical protein|nr:MAG TPA: integrin [Herelleviridae sp.]